MRSIIKIMLFTDFQLVFIFLIFYIIGETNILFLYLLFLVFFCSPEKIIGQTDNL